MKFSLPMTNLLGCIGYQLWLYGIRIKPKFLPGCSVALSKSMSGIFLSFHKNRRLCEIAGVNGHSIHG